MEFREIVIGWQMLEWRNNGWYVRWRFERDRQVQWRFERDRQVLDGFNVTDKFWTVWTWPASSAFTYPEKHKGKTTVCTTYFMMHCLGTTYRRPVSVAFTYPEKHKGNYERLWLDDKCRTVWPWPPSGRPTNVGRFERDRQVVLLLVQKSIKGKLCVYCVQLRYFNSRKSENGRFERDWQISAFTCQEKYKGKTACTRHVRDR